LDRDLSGLELAVLSACETGLGDVADGQGVFGLQRAFHLAGCRNVVASLWKVDDLATAALMGEFYRRLWAAQDPLPPIEALRQAQLAVMRADPKQFKAMAMRGIGKGEVKDPDVRPEDGPPPGGKVNPPVYWAAFTLSGLGR
jgi:CHAT domain-containing protein